ncbi:MAG: hypothetical protein GY948_00575, partial [Alphaproteobacteria bacterium]|nr:hypothetical protein [Alphaproteobacteria bacterium]
PDGGTVDVGSVPGSFAAIQDAIDGGAAGDVSLVAPGVYNELVIMWKPVKLQGWGAGAVTINARQAPTEKIQEWRNLATSLDASGAIDRLPGQALAPFAFPALAEALFPTEEGAGIFVAGKRTGTNRFGRLANRGARIDGFTILGASTGGGIIANGYNQFLNISNNRLIANAGFYGGGIRVGHPQLSHETAENELVYDDAINDNIRIHHNQVIKNGGFNGAGGGISLHTGADRYRVQDNWICGNFSQGDGGGIGHLGLSDNGLIEDNRIIFNETFNQAVGTTPSGGGIFIGGQPGLVPNGDNLVLTPGTGDVIIDGNLIRGNLAGAGDGAGIRIANVNGLDVAANLGNLQTPAERWHRLFVFNNMINNNVAGVAGGGISLSDALDVVIRNNTVANNDSTSTGSAAFMAGVTPNLSEPLPAGIVSRLHSPDLAALMSFIDSGVLPVPGSNPLGRAAQTWIAFSDPVLRDDIIYHNRSFYWANFDNPATPVIETGLVPATCAPNDASCNVATENVDSYSDDLGVLDGNLVTADQLNPLFSLLTDTSGYHGSNTAGNPAFVNGYFNESRDGLLQTE